MLVLGNVSSRHAVTSQDKVECNFSQGKKKKTKILTKGVEGKKMSKFNSTAPEAAPIVCTLGSHVEMHSRLFFFYFEKLMNYA